MSYRYSALDVVVGVGLCAILFGALLFFIATSGTFLAAAPQMNVSEAFSGVSSEMAWLQPAMGQAVVERALLQRHTDQITAAATSEWNQALQAHRRLQGGSAGPFGFILHRAIMVPEDHAARVQTVMGRSIVNFTKRGIRSGTLSADLYLSDYNRDMIGVTESSGQRMRSEFASTWQPVLGRWIVDVGRDQWQRVGAVQEQLGSAIVHMTQAKTVLEDAWAANQYQLGTLMSAVDRQVVTPDGRVLLAKDQAKPLGEPMASVGTISRSEVPMGYMILAAFALCCIFFAGLTLSAASREARALAEAKRNAGRWIYRMAG